MALTLPISYFHQRRPGESLSLLSNDAAIISHFVTTTLVSLLPLLLTFLGAFVFMLLLDAQIALVAVLLLPVYFVARTLLKNPPILVLDEATALFDPQGEKDFIEQCSELLEQRTVILITHRPASLALADRVLKMRVPTAVIPK